MSISFQCSCGKRMKARPELGGRPVRCPQCGAVTTIPLADANSSASTEPESTFQEQEPVTEPAAAVPWATLAEAEESSDGISLPWLQTTEQPPAQPVPEPKTQPKPAKVSTPPVRPEQKPAATGTATQKTAPSRSDTSPRAEEASAPVAPAKAPARPQAAPVIPRSEPITPVMPRSPIPLPAEEPVLLASLVVEEQTPLSSSRPAKAATGSEDEAMPKVSREPWYVPFVESAARFLMAANIVLTVAVPALLLIGGLISVIKTGDPRALFSYRLGPVPVAYTLLGLFGSLVALALFWAAPMLIVLDLSRRIRVLSRRLDAQGKPSSE